MTFCVICGLSFDARHSYGLCPLCISQDRMREYDRLASAKRQANISPVSLTLVEWLATLSDFAGKCAFCDEYNGGVIEMVSRECGLTYNNVVPACRACHALRKGMEDAEDRVRQYLHSERVQQTT